MRAVIQRVTEASVTVGGKPVSQIGTGLLVLLGVEIGDTEKDAAYLAGKTGKLRVFEDSDGKMNLSVCDVKGEILAVSQFTLLGDTRGQNRPSFVKAEKPEEADRLYRYYCEKLEESGIPVKRGIFRADMKVRLLNDGPVTILLDSRKIF